MNQALRYFALAALALVVAGCGASGSSVPSASYVQQGTQGTAQVSGSPSGPQWVQVPGYGTDIGVGPNNAAWTLAAQYPCCYGNYEVASYSASTQAWTLVSGAYASRIAVAPDTGMPWLATDDGRIFEYNGSAFVQIPGYAADIGVGPNSIAWVLARQYPDGKGNYEVAYYSPSSKTWSLVNGAYGARIAVSPDTGTPWLVTAAHLIYKWNGSSFVLMPGHGADIAVGPNGIGWTLGTDYPDKKGNYQVFQWSPGTGTWIANTGFAVNIAVSPTGIPWVVNAAGGIFEYVGAN